MPAGKTAERKLLLLAFYPLQVRSILQFILLAFKMDIMLSGGEQLWKKAQPIKNLMLK
ncbi:MAG: hypothetical protein K0S76_197 [Herbinix sp.]|nr:hypothetical protein [Herbinix sp.]